MTNLSQGKADFFVVNQPQIAEPRGRQPNEKSAGVKESGVSFYSKSFLTKEMRLYVAKAIVDSGREIRCEKCGKYEDLEFHHLLYEDVKIKDIRINCNKCHRNSKIPKENRRSRLKTVFENGKRFCEVSGFKFEY